MVLCGVLFDELMLLMTPHISSSSTIDCFSTLRYIHIDYRLLVPLL